MKGDNISVGELSTMSIQNMFFLIPLSISLFFIFLMYKRQRQILIKVKKVQNRTNFLTLSHPKIMRWAGLGPAFLFNTLFFIDGTQLVKTSNSSPANTSFFCLFIAFGLLLFWFSFEILIVYENTIEKLGIFRKLKTYDWDQISDYRFTASSGHQFLFKNGSKLSVSEHLIGSANLMERFAHEYHNLVLNRFDTTTSHIEILRLLYLLGLSGEVSAQKLILSKYLTGYRGVKHTALAALLTNIGKSKSCDAVVLEKVPPDTRQKIEAYLKSI